MVGVTLPFTWAGRALGFTPLPALYWPLVTAMLLCYATLTHLVKLWFVLLGHVKGFLAPAKVEASGAFCQPTGWALLQHSEPAILRGAVQRHMSNDLAQ